MLEFSIIIPVKELNGYLEESVPIIQSLQQDNWELIILPDKVGINPWKTDARIKLVETGVISPGSKRDIGASQSKGSFLVFLDDDSYPSFDVLEKISLAFSKSSRIVAVGGPGVTPKNSSILAKASGAFYESWLSGSDKRRYVPSGSSIEVVDWPSVNLTVRRQDFLDLDGFGSEFWPGEDSFLCDKIQKSGGVIQYDPSVLVFHHRRSSLKAHLLQISGYGLHRGNFARHLRGNSFKLKYFIPSLFSIFVLTTIVLNLLHINSASIFSGILVMYFSILFLLGLKSGKNNGLFVILLFPVYTFSSHLAYGLSFMRGFLSSTLIKSRLR